MILDLEIQNRRIISHYLAEELRGGSLAERVEHDLSLAIQVQDSLARQFGENPRQSQVLEKLIDTVAGLHGEVSASRIEIKSMADTRINSESLVNMLTPIMSQILIRELPENDKRTAEEIRKIVKESLTEARSDAYKQLQNAESERINETASAINDLSKSQEQSAEAIGERLRKVEDNASETVAIVRNLSTAREIINSTRAKGDEYELVMAELLSTLASARGHAFEDVHDVKGEAGDLKGDSVTTVMDHGQEKLRIVWEAKSGKMTRSNWLAEQEGSLKNRGAEYFVGLAKTPEGLPGSFNFQILNERGFILRLDPEDENCDLTSLYIGYVLAETLGRGFLTPDHEVDLDEVRSRVVKLEALLKNQLRPLRTALNAAEKGVTSAKSALDSLIQSMLNELSDFAASVADQTGGV